MCEKLRERKRGAVLPLAQLDPRERLIGREVLVWGKGKKKGLVRERAMILERERKGGAISGDGQWCFPMTW
jgi:hypothetical protein